MLPSEVVEQILSLVFDQTECLRAGANWKDTYPNKEAIAQSTALISALTVSRQWSAACLRVVDWAALYHELDGRHRSFPPETLRSFPHIRVAVYCTVEQFHLSKAVHRFVKDARLVYTSPKMNRRYDTDKLGIGKLKKLGKARLNGERKKEFIALTRRYGRIHKTYLRLKSNLRNARPTFKCIVLV